MTGWRGHVTEFGEGGHGAAAAADGDKGARAALAPGCQTSDLVGQGRLPGVGGVTDVANGLRAVAGEAGARIERAVGADGGLLPGDVRGEPVASYPEICRTHYQYDSA